MRDIFLLHFVHVIEDMVYCALQEMFTEIAILEIVGAGTFGHDIDRDSVQNTYHAQHIFVASSSSFKVLLYLMDRVSQKIGVRANARFG